MFRLKKDWQHGKKTIRTEGSSQNRPVVSHRTAKVASQGLNRPVACPDSMAAITSSPAIGCFNPFHVKPGCTPVA